jgi:hypothetical protein
VLEYSSILILLVIPRIMIDKKSLVFAVLFVPLFSLCALSQSPAPPPDSRGSSASRLPLAAGEKFFSVDAGFAIDLPRNFPSHQSVAPVARWTTGGTRYVWNVFGTAFVVEIEQLANPSDEPRNVISDVVSGVIANMAGKGYRVIDRKEIEFDQKPGLEMRFGLKNGTTVARYFVVAGRLYALITSWPEGHDGTEETKILNTFRLINVKEYVDRQLEEATPAPLPQSPVVKRAKSDAAIDRLKGHVASVVVSTEHGDGSASGPGTIRSSEDTFDRSGNRLKQISYDYRGNPRSANVYGFIDGKRVVRQGRYISYEYDPPPPPAPLRPRLPNSSAPVADTRPPADDRYALSHEYRFTNGRLTEERVFNNRGELSYKTIYVYDGNRVTETTTGPDDKVRWKSLEVFDDKDNLTERTVFSTSTYYPDDTKYQYTYLEFDKNGNWTKREVKEKSGVYGGGTKDMHYFEYRTISYF